MESEIFQNLEFQTFTVGEGDDAREVQETHTDSDTLIRKFEEYFVVKRNIIYEQTKFHERQQKEGQTVEEYYRILRSLITHCQYRNVEEQVRDGFVVGLRNRNLKERLQLTHNLTLTKALEIARKDEQIKQQMREQNNEGSNVADEARRKFRHRPFTTQAGRAITGQLKQNSDHTKFQNYHGRGRGRAGGVTAHPKVQCGQCGLQHVEGHCPA